MRWQVGQIVSRTFILRYIWAPFVGSFEPLYVPSKIVSNNCSALIKIRSKIALRMFKSVDVWGAHVGKTALWWWWWAVVRCQTKLVTWWQGVYPFWRNYRDSRSESHWFSTSTTMSGRKLNPTELKLHQSALADPQKVPYCLISVKSRIWRRFSSRH